MGRASSRKHAATDGNGNRPEVRVQLTPREFADHYGLCAVAALKIQAIQQQAAQAIAAAQQPKQQSFLRLVKKYRAQGLRPDQDYAFDEATYTLVAIPPERA
jgi:hypothetical protein